MTTTTTSIGTQILPNRIICFNILSPITKSKKGQQQNHENVGNIEIKLEEKCVIRISNAQTKIIIYAQGD